MVQPNVSNSWPVAEASTVSEDDRCNQTRVLEATAATADVSTAAVSVGLFDFLFCKLLFDAFCLTSIKAKT